MLNILVIDDDGGDRKHIKRTLESAFDDGVQLLEAATGKLGLEAIEQHPLHCVLLDYSLPDINGVEVLKRIRITHPYLPVVMIDGKGKDVIAVQSMKEGAQDYIGKGTITSPILHRVVRMAIEHGNLQKHSHDQRVSLEIFARALAHDLKEPVRSIRTFLGQINDRQNLSERSQEYFQKSSKAADRMNVLIDAVYLYTRLDAAQEIEMMSCDISSIMKEVQDNLAHLIAERGARITCDTLPMVHANLVQMIQLFQNLMTNAIQHCESAVTIHVTAEEHDDHWQLGVRDNGSGIAHEHLEKLFDPFNRLSHRKEGGLGLGLAISRKIVESHGGQIWYEPEAGGGSVFLFTLPKVMAMRASENPASIPLEDSCDQQASGGARTLASILLVDDNEDDIEMNRIILSEYAKLRCTLLTARDGKEALTRLQDSMREHKPIDLILLDINMPIMSGFDFLDKIQKEQTQILAHTLVVMLTTSTHDVDKMKAKSLGARGYLTKPLQFPLLKDIVDHSGIFQLSQ